MKKSLFFILVLGLLAMTGSCSQTKKENSYTDSLNDSIYASISNHITKGSDVTTFLGIPVDGPKSEMIKKLEDKGFVYHKQTDCLTGEFNDQEVELYIVTNDNKVRRIAVAFPVTRQESQIKIQYNKLYQQFQKKLEIHRIRE